VKGEQGVEGLKEHSMERKRLEEELYVVYAALNSAASGIVITDKKGNIQYANPAFLRMFDYESEKEVTGKYAPELFAPQEGRRFDDIEAIIDKSKGETEEVHLLRKDGTIFHVEVSTSIITDNEGHDVGRMASFADITERNQIEKALRESSEKIRLFAYSVSMLLQNGCIETMRICLTRKDRSTASRS
jgi:PAS domain S-box-containing protein